jgi:outer membrane beta-barrel protein
MTRINLPSLIHTEKTHAMSKLLNHLKTCSTSSLLVLIISLLTVQVVSAQEKQEGAKMTTPKDQITQDLALFWGNKRAVKVVQRRMYQKEGKMEATLTTGVIPKDDFLLHYLVGARVGYYFTESMMVEGSFNYAFDQNSGLSDYLKNSDIGLKEALIRQYIKFFYNVSVLWSPIYGKFSLLGAKLAHFNMYTGLGLGLMHTEGYEQQNIPDRQPKTDLAFNAIVGFRWHLTQMFSLRTEYRHFLFEQIGGGGVSTPIALNFSLSASF